jgi:hypothetical protein
MNGRERGYGWRRVTVNISTRNTRIVSVTERVMVKRSFREA